MKWVIAFLDYFCSLVNSIINIVDFDLPEGVTNNIFFTQITDQTINLMCEVMFRNKFKKNPCSVIQLSNLHILHMPVRFVIILQSCPKSEKLPETGNVAKHLRNSTIWNNSNWLKYISKGLLSWGMVWRKERHVIVTKNEYL